MRTSSEKSVYFPYVQETRKSSVQAPERSSCSYISRLPTAKRNETLTLSIYYGTIRLYDIMLSQLPLG